MKRWLRLHARVRYWRRRAKSAESNESDLRAQLEAEKWRNLEREDILVMAPLRMAGLWGTPPPRTEPAIAAKREVRETPRLAQSTDPWDTLSGADKAEFEMYWKADAEAAGVGILQARERFLTEVVLPRRQPLMDDWSAN